jgi:hypothetical protein
VRKKLSRGKAFWFTTATTLVLATGIAIAATVDLDDTRVKGGGHTAWNSSATDNFWCLDTPTPQGTALAEEGKAGDRHDGPDGALMLAVQGEPFTDPDGMGTKNGETIKAGPDTLSNIRVKVTETAIQDEPAVRMLYSLTNTKGSKATKTVKMGSNMGSDSDTRIERTSSGDRDFGASDRWVVTSEKPDPLGTLADPPFTNVLYGKHAGTDVVDVVAKPESLCDHGSFADDVLASFIAKIPAHSTRYLMFFAEMNQDSNAKAVHEAKKYNDRHLSNSLLKGLSNGVRSKILNWDL